MPEFLGSGIWPSLARLARQPGVCEIDLRDVRMAYPPGTVGLLLLTQYRREHNLPTHIRCPRSTDVLNYLERIDFFAKAGACASFDADLEELSHHRRNPSDRFTEILTPSDEGFEEALTVIGGFLRKHFPEQADAAFRAFEEVLQNIDDHSAPGRDPAYSCVQVQVFETGIELALGDLGVGFRASLSRNPNLAPFESEEEALRGALIHRYTRLPNNRARGGGLRHAVDTVRERGGIVRIRSRDGTVHNRPNSGRLAFDSVAHAFPGTLVAMQIPRRSP